MIVVVRRDKNGQKYLTPTGEWQDEQGKALAFFYIGEALEYAKQAGGTHVLNTRVGNTVTV